MDNLEGRILGKYRLGKVLGSGGFAKVYLAEHVRLDIKVAIKIPYMHFEWGLSEEIEHLRREANIMARLRHPNIRRMVEFGVENNIPYLVMDFCSRGSLRDIYRSGTQVSLDVVVSFITQIASALQYMHNENLIYNAVKPQNILLGDRNEILLSDFGETILVPNQDEQTKVVGTIGYMAPEQFVGKLCQASDQYTLSIVAYEWLSGYRPVGTKWGNPSLPSKISISPLIEEVILKALAKEPEKRFKRVEAFANALRQASNPNSTAIAPLPVQLAQPDPPIQPAQPPLKQTSTPERGVEIFLCYAREDEALIKNLEKHLRILQRQGFINVWYDRNINAGMEWEQEIKRHLNSAQIILLLISPDFMDSDYCYSIEMKRAIERHESGEACVVPVILRPTLWQKASFGKLQALPKDAVPVMSSGWHNIDEALFSVADGIQKIIGNISIQP